MNKLDLINKLAASLGDDAKKEFSKRTVDLFFEQIKQALAAEENVEFRGFGVFGIKTTNSYIGRNPRTGEKVVIPPRKHPIFKASLNFKKHLNKTTQS